MLFLRWPDILWAYLGLIEFNLVKLILVLLAELEEVDLIIKLILRNKSLSERAFIYGEQLWEKLCFSAQSFVAELLLIELNLIVQDFF